MGLFGGKTKSSDEAQEERKNRRNSRSKSRPEKKRGKKSQQPRQKKGRHNAAKDSNGERRKPKNELLSSVLDESVPGASLTELRENKKFTTTRHGVPCHVAMMLDVDAIGGLSRKAAARSEDKGAIIECIASGRIKVIATNALMRANRFIIIPDKSTLEAVDEFAILRNAPYTAAFIDDEGSDTFTQIDEGDGEPIIISFNDAEMVSNGELTIDELLEERVDSPVHLDGEEDKDKLVPSADGRDVPRRSIDERQSKTDSSIGISDEPEEDFFSEEIDIPEFEDIVLDEPDTDFVQNQVPMDIPEVTSPGVTAQIPSIQSEPEEIVDIVDTPDEVFEQVEQVDSVPVQESVLAQMQPADFDDFARNLTRTFYSADLPFEISMEPFNNMFVTNNEAPKFSTDRGDGWLAEQLNQMSQDANADLDRLHRENLAYLSQRYSHLMGLYIDGLVKRVDVNDESNRYGQTKAILRKERDTRLQNMNARVDADVIELDSRFEEQVKETGELARLKAENQFRQRHEREREQRRTRIVSQVRAEIDAEYRSDLDDLMSTRQEEAATRIDYGVTQILGILHEQYDEMRREEMARFETYRESFSRWIDDNRKEDIAYAQAIAEDQRQGEKSERLRHEYEQQFQQQQEDFEKRRQRLEQQIDDIKRDRDEKFEDMERRYVERLARVEEERDLANKRLDEAMDKYNALGEEKDKEYERRIATLKDENEASNIRFEALTKQHRSTSILWIAVGVIAIICSLSIGIIIGFNQNVNTFANNSSAIVMQDSDSAMVQSWLDI